jgi:hypothetical protein
MSNHTDEFGFDYTRSLDVHEGPYEGLERGSPLPRVWDSLATVAFTVLHADEDRPSREEVLDALRQRVKDLEQELYANQESYLFEVFAFDPADPNQEGG